MQFYTSFDQIFKLEIGTMATKCAVLCPDYFPIAFFPIYGNKFSSALSLSLCTFGGLIIANNMDSHGICFCDRSSLKCI